MIENAAQLRLLVDPVPPSRPVTTSIAAAAEAEAFAGEQRERVYDFIKRCGPRGATQKEIALWLQLGRPSVCARTWELHGGKRHGAKPEYLVRIVRTGERRERCAVYVAI